MNENDQDLFYDIDPNKLIELFDEMTFKEKWEKVSYGLKQPKDSGDYKWAKFQVKRLAAPISSVIVPILTVLLLMIFSSIKPPPSPPVVVQIIEPEPMEELIPPEPPEPTEQIEPPEVFDPNITPDLTTSTDNSPNNGPEADFSPVPASFNSVAMVKSPIIMKGMYSSRNPGMRGSLLGKGGGGNGTEGAVLRALRWLKKNQNSDGSWEKVKPAMTGMALLSFLAHGETPTSEEFGRTVEYAIKWLVDNQNQEGRFNGSDGHEYSLPIAAYALSEAYGITKVPTVKYAAEKAIDIIIKGQHPSGGWDYNCKQNTRDDTSYMGWCAQALKAAYMAGLENVGLKDAMEKSVNGFRKNYGEKDGYGGFGYTSPSSHGGNAMEETKLTGVGTLCMQLMGSSKFKEVQSSVVSIEQNHYDWTRFTWKEIYWRYYDTQAMFHQGGQSWKNWNAKFSPTLVKNQIIMSNAIETPEGKMVDIGYWIPGKEGGIVNEDNGQGGSGGGGIVQDTCLSALQLMVYYRYLPTFQKVEEIIVEKTNQNNDINIDIQF